MKQKRLMPIRVLISGHLPPPIGGIATYYQSILASTLVERVNLRFVQTSSQTRKFSESGRASLANAAAAFKDVLRFTRAAISFRPNVSHIATAFGLSFIKHSLCVLAAHLFGSRVLLHPHCSLSALYWERSGWWKWYFRQIIRQTDGVIALSKEWLDLPTIVPSARVFFLPNAVPMTAFQQIALEKTAAQENAAAPIRHTVRVLYLGYIGQAKGSFDLATAAGQVLREGTQMDFDLVGGVAVPGEREQIQLQVDQAGLRDHFQMHPAVFGDEKLEFFRRADIFAYPSYNEGMPMAVLEAMACGLPVVATRIGGLPDLVVDGLNGRLVEPGHPDQLASALLELANNPQLRCQMGQASRKLVAEKFDIEQHVKALTNIYQDVAARKASTASYARG